MSNQLKSKAMKKNNYFTLILTFLAGLILGGLIIWIVPHPGPCPPTLKFETPQVISTSDANTAFNKYFNQANPLNDKLKGLLITKVDLDSINNIVKTNSGFAAYRIYFGIDNNANNIGIVVGVANAGVNIPGTDAVNSKIYRFPLHLTGPCPEACDNASDITRPNNKE